jgi:hypothetical protein
MPDDHRSGAGTGLPRRPPEHAGEDGSADGDGFRLAAAHRIQPKAPAPVVELRRDSRPLDPRELQRLSGLTQADWVASRQEWMQWYRRYQNFGPAGVVKWCISVLVAWFCLGQPSAVAGWMTGVLPSLGAAPLWSYKLLGWIALVGVAVFVQRAFGTLFASAYWDAYSAGYSNGVRLGVDRALEISRAEERGVPKDASEARPAREQNARPVDRVAP